MTSKSLRITAVDYNKTTELIISRKALDYLTWVFKKIILPITPVIKLYSFFCNFISQIHLVIFKAYYL